MRVEGEREGSNLMSKLESDRGNHYFNIAKIGVEGNLEIEILQAPILQRRKLQAQRGKVTCPRLHSTSVAEAGLEQCPWAS